MDSMPLHSHIKPYFIPRKKYISTYPEGKMLVMREPEQLGDVNFNQSPARNFF